MGRPLKDLDTPELKKVAEKKAELDAAKAVEKAKRREYDDAVVAALEDHGLRTLAKVAEVSTSSIREIREKRAAAA